MKKKNYFENTMEFTKTNHCILIYSSQDVELGSRWHNPVHHLPVLPQVNGKKNKVQAQSSDPWKLSILQGQCDEADVVAVGR